MLKVLVSSTLVFCFLWGAAPVKGQAEKIAAVVPLHSDADMLGSPEQITIPQLLNYQGKLTDASGNPVRDSTYSITFRLFTVPTGGTPFWAEAQTIQTRQGLFNTQLGALIPITSIPADGNCYLEMQVEPNPPMTPRIRIVSSAYAYLAKKADSANYAASASLTRPITPPIATGEIADGAVNSAKIADSAVTMPKINRAGATAGQVIKWTGSAWAPGTDEVGGPPSGPAGGDLTGTYPNPTIAANAVNSVKILDGSIRGVDIAKPCTLSAAATNILVVSNTGGVIGSPAIYSSAVNGPGLLVKSGLQAGVFVDSTGSNSSAFYARKTTRAGVEVDSATSYGFWLRQYAGNDGVSVARAGDDGVSVARAGDAGVSVDSAGYGVFVARASGTGVYVEVASEGVSARGVIAGGRFSANIAAAKGLCAHAYENLATDTAIQAYGRGYATGGWYTGGLLGDKEAPCLISPELGIIAAGTGRLVQGKAEVFFDPIVSENIRTDIPIRITVTPRGKPAGILYVSESKTTGFLVEFAEIPGLEKQSKDITFDWIAFATLKEYETSPKAKMEWERMIEKREAKRSEKEIERARKEQLRKEKEELRRELEMDKR